MALYPVLLLASTQLPNAVASQGGPTSPTKWLVKRAVFTNTDTAAHTITVHHVPNGGSPSAGNIVIEVYGLGPQGQPGHTYVAAELTDMIFNSGDTLQCFSDTANVVNVTVSGFTFQ